MFGFNNSGYYGRYSDYDEDDMRELMECKGIFEPCDECGGPRDRNGCASCYEDRCNFDDDEYYELLLWEDVVSDIRRIFNE
jgi:hypothetical protein